MSKRTERPQQAGEWSLPDEMDRLGQDIEDTHRRVLRQKVAHTVQKEKLRQALAEVEAQTQSAQVELQEQKSLAANLENEKQQIQAELDALKQARQETVQTVTDLDEYRAQINAALRKHTSALENINNGLMEEITALEAELGEDRVRDGYMNLLKDKISMDYCPWQNMSVQDLAEVLRLVTSGDTDAAYALCDERQPEPLAEEQVSFELESSEEEQMGITAEKQAAAKKAKTGN